VGGNRCRSPAGRAASHPSLVVMMGCLVLFVHTMFLLDVHGLHVTAVTVDTASLLHVCVLLLQHACTKVALVVDLHKHAVTPPVINIPNMWNVCCNLFAALKGAGTKPSSGTTFCSSQSANGIWSTAGDTMGPPRMTPWARGLEAMGPSHKGETKSSGMCFGTFASSRGLGL
jgi:hypothetical protein